jgi:hypothetical protein
MNKTFFIAWGGLPWRKPLAMTSAFVTLVIISYSAFTGRDIPLNTSNLLIWFDTVILSWAYGTSAAEAIKNVKKE